jgi:Leucine-rich repeat (LRR) protein
MRLASKYAEKVSYSCLHTLEEVCAMIMLRSIWTIRLFLLMSMLATVGNVLGAAVNCTDTVTTGVPEAECNALVAIYDATDGASWTNSSNWKTDTNVATWYGVSVSTSHVSIVILLNNNLVGSIPAEIGNLTQLFRLDLSNNNLSGVLPDAITNMTELDQLELYNNALTGPLPSTIGNLNKLSYFDASVNRISGSIPPSIGALVTLKHLNLYNNDLSGSIPIQIGNLSSLQQLNLSSNQLSGSIPDDMGSLIMLEKLLLGQNRLNGSIPSNLGTLNNLVELMLQNNRLNGDIPPELGGLSNVQELDFSNNQLTGPIPPSLGNLSSLLKLYLTDNQLTDAIPVKLGDLAALTNLQLSGNQLEGPIPDQFSALTALQNFSVQQNHLDADENGNAVISPSLQTWFNAIPTKDISQQTPPPIPGVTIDPVIGLVTTEAGGTANFDVVLNTRPTADVSVNLLSSDLTEGTVNPTTLVFTPVNWFAQQTVTLSGVDDPLIDGNQDYTITSTVSSGDIKYNNIAVSDVSAVNADDDQAGITVSPTSGLITTEAGGTAVFTVLLNTQPSSDVTIGLTSTNTKEGTISTSSVTFNTGNWNIGQTVTVTGIDDAINDGDQAYRVLTAPADSSDTDYKDIDPPDVNLINKDNDSDQSTAGITVSPCGGVLTTEKGGTATFTVVLNTQPGANVTLDISSSDTSEGVLNPANLVTLTFTPADWNQPQTVTITGVDDVEDDGDQPYTVITHPSSSADTGYNALNPKDVRATNEDDDTAGVTISPSSGLITTESGGIADFTAVLDSQPTANVNLNLSSSDTSEGSISPASLIFTSANWNVPQTVTLTGVEDLLVDGDMPYSIITDPVASTDAVYNGLVNPDDVSVINQDNDPEPSCSSPPADVILKTGFLPGQYLCIGDNSIKTNAASSVIIENGAEVHLHAPVVEFNRTFSIEDGGVLDVVTPPAVP